ncbi:hypothetical protein GCM10023231_38400 [Olivibacter ginsenosidimutans]|uniref:Uncharacterized protein n=1 Tax=Olivibacter ginsenosidimutans TaxID=1176537 RepID=A0ABP9C733_9SPHI
MVALAPPVDLLPLDGVAVGRCTPWLRVGCETRVLLLPLVGATAPVEGREELDLLVGLATLGLLVVVLGLVVVLFPVGLAVLSEGFTVLLEGLAVFPVGRVVLLPVDLALDPDGLVVLPVALVVLVVGRAVLDLLPVGLLTLVLDAVELEILLGLADVFLLTVGL